MYLVFSAEYLAKNPRVGAPNKFAIAQFEIANKTQRAATGGRRTHFPIRSLLSNLCLVFGHFLATVFFFVFFAYPFCCTVRSASDLKAQSASEIATKIASKSGENKGRNRS